ncbi:hypothetical protein C8T65DRAFT_825220, partial [Cerioporus squamosus]
MPPFSLLAFLDLRILLVYFCSYRHPRLARVLVLPATITMAPTRKTPSANPPQRVNARRRRPMPQEPSQGPSAGGPTRRCKYCEAKCGGGQDLPVQIWRKHAKYRKAPKVPSFVELCGDVLSSVRAGAGGAGSSGSGSGSGGGSGSRTGSGSDAGLSGGHSSSGDAPSGFSGSPGPQGPAAHGQTQDVDEESGAGGDVEMGGVEPGRNGNDDAMQDEHVRLISLQCYHTDILIRRMRCGARPRRRPRKQQQARPRELRPKSERDKHPVCGGTGGQAGGRISRGTSRRADEQASGRAGGRTKKQAILLPTPETMLDELDALFNSREKSGALHDKLRERVGLR